MAVEQLIADIVAIVGLVSVVVTWLIADAKIKARITFVEERVASVMAEIQRDIEKLDQAKASKEFVGTIQSEIALFRQEMDRRFDVLEKILSNNHKNGGANGRV